MNTAAIISLDHYYEHPPAAIWRALTDPDLHALWWAAGNIKAVVGHQFDLDMGPWGKQPCEVLEVEPGRRLKYRFATRSLNTTITWELVPEGSGTRLFLTHEGFDLNSPLSRKALEGMRPGWPKILSKLDAVLGGRPIKPLDCHWGL